MLAQHHGVSVDAAFNRLRSYAPGNNLRLAEVARQCIALLRPSRGTGPPDRSPVGTALTAAWAKKPP